MSSLRASTVGGPQIQSPTAHIARHSITASHDLDPADLQAQLDLAATAFGLGRCIDEIVIPATRRLHLLVVTGHRDHAQELIATETIRAWLNRRGWTVPAPEPIGTILLGCGPRDSDAVGPESLALLLRVHRRPCRVLGTRTSTVTLTVAAQAADTWAWLSSPTTAVDDPRPSIPSGPLTHWPSRCSTRETASIFIAADRTFPADTWAPASSQQAAATIIKTLPPTVPRH